MSYCVDKIKVGFVLWTFRGMGGSERVVYDIARKLDKKRYLVVVIGFEDGPVREVYQKLGLKAYGLYKGEGFDWRLIYNLRKILINEQIAVVNPHHFMPLFYTFWATRLTAIKLVYTEHSRWQLEQLSFLSRLMNKFILSKSDAAVAISRQIEDYYREVVSLRKDKIYFINNGIDVELYRERNGNKLREELGIKKDEIVLGMVGNLRPEKNHKLLISAFTKVEKEVKNIHLVLAGRDFMEGEIQRFAEATGVKERIHFLGERDDVPRLLGIFDIFCLSSLYEGMPLTLLEAMASGVPVIGSDVLGINEVITDNINGLLFPKNDEKKLAELIKRLLRDNDLRKRLIQEGKSFVEKYHNLDDRIKDYDKLFQTVYQGKS